MSKEHEDELAHILTIIPSDYFQAGEAFESVRALVSDWMDQNRGVLAERDMLRTSAKGWETSAKAKQRIIARTQDALKECKAESARLRAELEDTHG